MQTAPGSEDALLDTLVEMRSVLSTLRQSALRIREVAVGHEHQHHASRIMARIESLESEISAFRDLLQQSSSRRGKSGT